VWRSAAGKDRAPQQAEEVHAHIRARIAGRDAKIAALVRIQYGGSVKAAYAAELFSMPNVDGGSSAAPRSRPTNSSPSSPRRAPE
jgi:triosephosphate isomerase